MTVTGACQSQPLHPQCEVYNYSNRFRFSDSFWPALVTMQLISTAGTCDVAAWFMMSSEIHKPEISTDNSVTNSTISCSNVQFMTYSRWENYDMHLIAFIMSLTGNITSIAPNSLQPCINLFNKHSLRETSSGSAQKWLSVYHTCLNSFYGTWRCEWELRSPI